MGDRGNIAIAQPTKDGEKAEFVVLYTHWSGSEIPETLRKAIERANERADDPQYFARIAFDELTGGDCGLTGYGITTSIWDNGHPIVIADCYNQEVYTADEGDLTVPTSKKIKFLDYVAGGKANWETFERS